MQLFPERIIDLWNKCEVRVIILLSLVLQTILIIFGNRRKLTNRVWIKIIVWSAYLSADWVATVALGNLASSIGDSKDRTTTTDSALQEFWAPFLLLHLGGPDSITAYSLEDNELWLRHFLGLIIQVGVAFYVFFRSWGNTALTFLTIPIFISGVIKYGERTYVLWSSSSEHFKDSLPSSPDSCQDFVKYIDDQDMRGKREEGSEEAMVIPQDGIHKEDNHLVLAYFLFNRTKFFFAERTLDEKERKCIHSMIKNKQNAIEAFKLVAVELGLMYDVLYTKAAIVYSRLGIILRCITFFSSISALVVFSTIIDTHVYPLTDISVTYLLLVGAALLELYALILLLLSDWAKLWLIKLKKAQHNPISKTLVDLFWRFYCHSQSLLTSKKRWSESMGQYNLISSCLKDVQYACFGVLKLPFIGKWLESKYLTSADVNADQLQEKILQYIKEQGNIVDKNDDVSSYYKHDIFLTQRGGFALERYKFTDIYWCTIGVEFADSFIIWHIATDLCYYGDLDDKYEGDVRKVLDPKCKISKCLSDYMCYLLVFRLSMLPKGISEVRYKETCAEVTTLLKQKRDDDISSESKAWKALLQKYEEANKALLQKYKDSSVEELFDMKDSQSLLKQACFLYMLLQQRVGDDFEKKWEIISAVWVEMLAYTAHHCEWREHAQQLWKGGELLTHVCLLVAHFGLSKQYFHNVLTQITPKKPHEP
ncbi:hypothetical protein Dsin_014327 [Dipteronia sinensis]|uniref:DUF4220 domain-containing protein n=1 Tax=Dipteronia sinensis TaxID=43782 RepID=A0AAE0EA77_9ROSI|nr:hypothetical protein Dsin_014327 [Dipteronia sinensis]